jgi:hypothetical protein
VRAGLNATECVEAWSEPGLDGKLEQASKLFIGCCGCAKDMLGLDQPLNGIAVLGEVTDRAGACEC